MIDRSWDPKAKVSMKIILVHDWKILIQLVCKSVDFISKTFINKMKFRVSVTDNFKLG